MRIVLTSNFSPWSAYGGGGQRSTHNLATALAARGHAVTVLFTRPPWERVTPPTDLPYELGWAGLLSRNGRSPGLWRLSSAPTIARRIRALAGAGAPLIVHSQGEEAALLPALRRRGCRFGLIVTPRYPAFPLVLGRWRTSSLAERAGFVYSDAKYLALGAALRGADYCCPPSAFGARLVTEAYALPPERVVPVHNGVPAEFLEHHWRAPNDAREFLERPVLFFGRFAHDKGLDTLVEALGLLPTAKALLVGRGPLEASITRRIQELGLGERVRLHDWAEHATLGALLAEASMAVLPSVDENFSLAVLSAMAVGTPLVTTPVGGTPEVVEDGVTGKLVPVGDPVALAEAMRRIHAELAASTAMAARGKALVRGRFTWDRTAARFEEIYERTRA